jgi:ABC-type multidrug transport system fused ATPase/permease subunit
VLLDLARPWPLALAVDHAIDGDPLFGLAPGALLVVAALSLVLVTAGAGLVDMAAIVAAERAAERVGARLREDVFGTALTLSLRWHDRTRSGELISRITTDVGRLLDALVAVWSTMLPDAVRLTMVLAVLFAINPSLALIGVAAIPVLAALSVRQRRRVRSAQQDARSESGRFAATAVDLLRNVRAVQAFGRADGASTVFRARNRSLLDVNLHAVTTEARWAPRADVVLAAGAGVVLVIGGNEVRGGAMSTGDLLVVMSYIAALYSPVRGLSRLSGLLAKASASAARVQEVLHCDERVSDRFGAVAAPPVRHSVRFAGVCFRYGDTHDVLTDFDLTIAAGETVAMAGPSGSGKTTLLHLLLRLYDVDAGAVLLDGVDVRDMTSISLRRRIALVPQDPWLSTRRSSTTSRSAHRMRPGTRYSPPAGPRWWTNSSAACPTGITRSSVRGPRGCPAASADASHWREPPFRTRPFSCSTSRLHRWIAHPPLVSSMRSAERPATGPSCSSPMTTTSRRSPTAWSSSTDRVLRRPAGSANRPLREGGEPMTIRIQPSRRRRPPLPTSQ